MSRLTAVIIAITILLASNVISWRSGWSSHADMKWFTEFGHLNRGDMLTSEQHRCHNEKKKFQRRV